MKIDRLLSIVILLLNRDRITARELAERFEVSIRTIYRDIDSINQAGIPIVSYPGTDGGFGIDSHLSFDRQVLSLTDITTMLSALKGIRSALDTRDLDFAIEKVGTLVPQREEHRLRDLDQRFAIDILPWGYQERQRAAMRIVYGAISDEKLLTFTYKNTRGEVQKRLVEPMTLVFKGYAWYLFAYCKIRNGYRVFRLSRMREVAVDQRGFIRRDADWHDYIEPSGGAAEPGMIRLHLRFAQKIAYRIEDYFNEEELTVLPNGDVDARIQFPEGEWIFSFLMSFGDDAEILEPEEIRSEFRRRVENIAKKYREP